ncbi:UvrD-helicase domain-containing protein [Candidatus Woesearchaeota archaeon]|nr:UvrD-helicase domain-containing protein [Candidatus Woesearchaeota archaeon]
MLRSSAKKIIKIIEEINTLKSRKIWGYITIPIIVGFFILQRLKKKITDLEESKEQVMKELKSFVNNTTNNTRDTLSEIKTNDTYLTYNIRNELNQKLSQNLKEIIYLKEKEIYFGDSLNTALTKAQDILTQSINQINVFNKEFVERRKEEYSYLFKKGPFPLDDNQKTAIVTDEKHNIVVAGAGSGKTEVLTTRIAYLINRKPDIIKSTRILTLAFQNKAAEEIKHRLKKRYDVDVEIRTFHSLGLKIIGDISKMKGVKPPKLKEECSKDGKYMIFMQDLFYKEFQNNPALKNEIINFMKLYGDTEVIRKETDFKTKEEFYEYQRSLRYTTLDGTNVESESERAILNFFVSHNINGKKIRILYEEPAKWMKYKNQEGNEQIPQPDFYFPDFDIYLEHWAIGKRGTVPNWFAGDNPTKEYTDSMNLKKSKYAEHKKVLIETSQADVESGKLNEELEKRFLNALKEKYPDEKHELTTITYNELVNRVWEECKEFVKVISKNISKYITIAKTYRSYPADIIKRLEKEQWSPKQRAFARIAIMIYTKYEEDLRRTNSMDFSDMINIAVDFLRENPEAYEDTYDHILIDEYQDISTQRYDMIKTLMNKNPSCKLFCVGDDWQSIMGFSGSNLDYFVNFSKYFPHPERTDLIRNYRSSKSIVDTGSTIINGNIGQIKKQTLAISENIQKIKVYSLLHQKDYFMPYYDQTTKHCLKTIKEYHTKKNYKYSDFMILMRIAKNTKIWNLLKKNSNQLGIPITESQKTPNAVRIMSVHKSKGLQAKVVIIINLNSGPYGFPCELETPNIYYTAISKDDGLRKQEERRLFYVAITRAKKEVIIYTQKCSMSKFIDEIKDHIEIEELQYGEARKTAN